MLSIASMPVSVLLQRIEQSQWAKKEEIQAYQHQQLLHLLSHHKQHNSFYRNFLKKNKFKSQHSATLDVSSLPILKRDSIQLVGSNFFTKKIPQEHEPIATVQTSGSTGQPVRVNKTAISAKLWAAYTMRDHLWNKRDFNGRLSSIRPQIDSYIEINSWGEPVAKILSTGQGQGIPITTDIKNQFALLQKFAPEILIIYPNNLKGLIDVLKDKNVNLPSIKHIKTVGETVSGDLRKQTLEVFGLQIEDSYSSQELGTIAIQCPVSGLYHVMSEAVLLEVLDDNDLPCQAGQIGRVVVTDLHNYASPLLRYDIGDYAEVGGECACGRSFPTLKRIVGRERNLIMKPDGSRHWPIFGFHQFDRVVPVRQYQFVQLSLTRIEMRLFPERKLTDADKKSITEIVRNTLDAPFIIDIVEFDSTIPSTKGGKFEEFISMCK